MNMKYISRILFTVGLVFGLSACTEDALETVGPKLPANGDMSVNLTFAMPDAEAQTRSKVSGTENRVHTMQMVCFDANGLYLGIRKAEISPYDENNPDRKPDAGTIKGTVPQGTSRIHFIALHFRAPSSDSRRNCHFLKTLRRRCNAYYTMFLIF